MTENTPDYSTVGLIGQGKVHHIDSISPDELLIGTDEPYFATAQYKDIIAHEARQAKKDKHKADKHKHQYRLQRVNPDEQYSERTAFYEWVCECGRKATD